MPPPAAPPPHEAPDPDFEMDEEEDPEEVEPWIESDSEPEPAQSALEPSSIQQHWSPPLPQKGTETAAGKRRGEEEKPRWPGWPGASVFRLLVPPDKVGGLIGRRGETIKRLCDETRVRVLDSAHGAAHRIVLVSATEEIEAELSPAMNAAIKIFKHINEIEGIDSNGTPSAAAPKVCYVRLLVPSAQAVHLIGKQGSTIKLIKESTGATIRIYDEDELFGRETLDERIVDIRGACFNVYNALKSVLGLLRKFLVDHGVLHLFERKTQARDTYRENQVTGDYPLPVNEDFWLPDERRNDRLLHGRDEHFSDSYPSDISHSSDSIITQVKQTMQIPLLCAEEIIGTRGQSIEFIRSVSGAVVILEECRHCPSEVLVSIKGSPSQVQKADQLVQEIFAEYREPPPLPRSRNRSVDACPMLLNPPHDTRAVWDVQHPFREDLQPTRLGSRGYWL